MMQFRYAASRRHMQCAIGWVVLLLAGWLPLAVAAQARAPVEDGQDTVLVMGDSLSAAYGLAAEQGWVALTAARIAQRKPGWNLVNASISGETSAGGAARIVDALVLHRPEVVVIALGANDGLRGLPVLQTRINLARMIGAAHGAGAQVLLIGMRMPPNLGAEYTRAFARSYRLLAERFDVALLPFLLQPIADARDAFQDDHLHPTAAAQPLLRDHVWVALEPLLD